MFWVSFVCAERKDKFDLIGYRNWRGMEKKLNIPVTLEPLLPK